MNRTITLVSLLTSMVLAVAGTQAHAALGGPSGIVIPYAGKLELDGALVTGTVDFEFGVAPDAEGTAPVDCVFTRFNIPVTNGEFAVSIDIPVAKESCVKGNDVHLVVRVARSGTALVLLGKQRVPPVVAAATSGKGDFAVTGALSAASAAVTGAMTAKSLVVNDPQSTLVADFNGLSIGSDTIRATRSATNQDIILVPKGSGIVEVTGSLLADRDVDIAGDVTVNGTLAVGYAARTCVTADYGQIGILFSYGFCACPAGSVALGGAADCTGKGAMRFTRLDAAASVFGQPAQSYVGQCTEAGSTLPFFAPVSVTVMCARLAP